MRIAPSRRIVSPFSIAFSMMWHASAANSLACPRRWGNGACLASEWRTGSGRGPSSGLPKMAWSLVEPPEAAHRGVEGGVHFLGARHVGRREEGGGAERLRDVGAGGRRAVQERHAAARLDEALGGGAPEPGGAAGHHCVHGAKFHGSLPRLAF